MNCVPDCAPNPGGRGERLRVEIIRHFLLRGARSRGDEGTLLKLIQGREKLPTGG